MLSDKDLLLFWIPVFTGMTCLFGWKIFLTRVGREGNDSGCTECWISIIEWRFKKEIVHRLASWRSMKRGCASSPRITLLTREIFFYFTGSLCSLRFKSKKITLSQACQGVVPIYLSRLPCEIFFLLFHSGEISFSYFTGIRTETGRRACDK